VQTGYSHTDLGVITFGTSEPMKDPRDKRYFALKKLDPAQLSDAEIRELIAYCDKMLEFVTARKARQGWIRERSSLNKKLERTA
jgi:hypothetical protein